MCIGWNFHQLKFPSHHHEKHNNAIILSYLCNAQLFLSVRQEILSFVFVFLFTLAKFRKLIGQQSIEIDQQRQLIIKLTYFFFYSWCVSKLLSFFAIFISVQLLGLANISHTMLLCNSFAQVDQDCIFEMKDVNSLSSL